MRVKKPEHLHVHLTEDQATALRLLAQLEQRSISGEMRQLVQDAARRHGLWPPDRALLERMVTPTT